MCARYSCYDIEGFCLFVHCPLIYTYIRTGQSPLLHLTLYILYTKLVMAYTIPGNNRVEFNRNTQSWRSWHFCRPQTNIFSEACVKNSVHRGVRGVPGRGGVCSRGCLVRGVPGLEGTWWRPPSPGRPLLRTVRILVYYLFLKISKTEKSVTSTRIQSTSVNANL